MHALRLSARSLGLSDRRRLMVFSIAILGVVSLSAVAVSFYQVRLLLGAPPTSPTLMAVAETLVLVVAGGALLVRVCNPFIRRLEESEARIRAIVCTAGDGIITVDPRGAIDSFNLAAERMFGCLERNVLGRNLEGLIALPAGVSQILAALGNHASSDHSYQALGRRGDGVWFPLELSIGHVTLGARSIYTISARDVTEREAAALQMRTQMLKLEEVKETLEAKAAELVKTNRELDDFTYIASHDLKEPLRGISSYCQILLEDYTGKLDDDGQRRLEALVGLCQRLGRLIDDLLTYSKIGRTQPESNLADLNAIVADVLDTLGPTIDEQSAVVRIVGTLPSIEADRIWVGEVFRNLIANALKFNDSPQPIVEVGCQDGATLYVRDNGIGISECHHEAIFAMFRRLHGRRKYDGTGAGLTFVRKIVEAHGGQVWLASQSGEGSTFYFTLGPGIAHGCQTLADCAAG